MADWIAEVDRIEAELAAEGVPASERMRVAALFADALAKADKAKRKARQEREAAKLLHYGAQPLAERQECHRSTIYRRAKRCRVLVGTVRQNW